MSVKLTDAQLVMLSAAAQREDLCLAPPDKMKGAILTKIGEKLAKLGWSEWFERRQGCPSGAEATPVRVMRSNSRRPP